MDKICRNCRWWELDEQDLNAPILTGDCNNENMPWISNGVLRKDGFDIRCDRLDDILFAEEFGCVHWEEK